MRKGTIGSVEGGKTFAKTHHHPHAIGWQSRGGWHMGVSLLRRESASLRYRSYSPLPLACWPFASLDPVVPFLPLRKV